MADVSPNPILIFIFFHLKGTDVNRPIWVRLPEQEITGRLKVASRSRESKAQPLTDNLGLNEVRGRTAIRLEPEIGTQKDRNWRNWDRTKLRCGRGRSHSLRHRGQQ